MRPQACSLLARARGVTVLRTDDPQRVLLRVTHTYENKRLLEGIVSRAKLAAALKAVEQGARVTLINANLAIHSLISR